MTFWTISPLGNKVVSAAARAVAATYMHNEHPCHFSGSRQSGERQYDELAAIPFPEGWFAAA